MLDETQVRVHRSRSVAAVALVIILTFGAFLRLPPSKFVPESASLHALARIHPSGDVTRIGFDEGLYRRYVDELIRVGLRNYPAIVDGYIEAQKQLPGSILPPVRFLFIFSAYIWHCLLGTEALSALQNVASFFSILTLLLATLFAWRLKGERWAIAIAALVAVAPTQVHMSQHALVDGFFTFWATLTLWTLWENLRAPRHPLWLSLYTLSFSLLVLTKENAFFVFVGVAALLIANRWLRFGTFTRELAGATLLGPLLGVVALVFLAGGLETLRTTYQLSVTKNFTLPYAILTGDGPWHRYLVDLLLVSPVVLILAIGAVYFLDREQKPELFMTIFVASTYLLMCNLKYGMNLRYANMWDLPLRVLAFAMVLRLASRVRRYELIASYALVAGICALEFRQYLILFIWYPGYELISANLLQALKILKLSGGGLPH